MNIKNWKPVLILSAVILAVVFCGLSMLRDQQEAEKPKTTTVTFDPSTLPDPPDPSIPKERTIEFSGQSYHGYFSSTSHAKYDYYRNKDYTFIVERESERIVRFATNSKTPKEHELTKDQLRYCAQQAAASFAKNDLADYTVTETLAFEEGCSAHKLPDMVYYFSVWTYGSEHPRTVAEESFVIALDATTGDVICMERPEHWPMGRTLITIFEPYVEFDVYVQLSKTVPFPQLPEVSQLEEMFFPTETE